MATNLIEVEKQSPFQTRPEQPTGLDLGEAILQGKDPIQFGAQVEAIDLGNQFATLLDQGQKGMVATAKALIEEGSLTEEDLQGLDPNLPAFQSEQGQLDWYKGVDKIIKEKEAKATRKETVSLTGKELADKGFEKGVDVGPLIEQRREIKREEDIEELFTMLRKGGAEIPEDMIVNPEETDVVALQAAKDVKEARRKALVNSGLGDDKRVKALTDRLKVESADLSKRIKAEQVQGRFEDKEGRILSEADKKAREKIAKETKSDRARLKDVNRIDSLLKEIGLPEGLESVDVGQIDVPGSGLLAGKGVRFEKGARGRLVNDIERVFAEERHALFGATLTGNELKSFNTLRGKQFLGNEEQMINSLRNIARSIKSNLQTATKRTGEAVEELTREPESKAPTGLSPEKQKRLEELQAKRDAGTLK